MSHQDVGRSFRTPTRRGFLGVTGGALASVWLASCAGERDDELADAAGGGTDAREAPQLAQMVENGELPPLEERLPDNPLVVDVVDRVGVYGGNSPFSTDRKSTRLNSSHVAISYAVFCLKKKNI